MPVHAPSEPPVIAGVRRRFVEARGVNFHVTEAGPQDGLPVLCLHGWPQHHYEWHNLLAAPPEGLRIIAPDLPGYGWSGAAPHRWFKEEVASDVLALLDELGVERALLVAHDWGAWVGYLLTLRAPERFSAYLPCNMVHLWNAPTALLPHLWRLYYQPIIGFLGVPIQRYTPFIGYAVWTSIYDKSSLTLDDVRVFSDRFRDPVCARAGSDTYRTFLVHEIPAGMRTPERRRSHVPTRGIFGIHDVAVRPAMAAVETARIDDYTLELVSDSGHFIVDEKPDLIRERVISLAAEFPPSPAAPATDPAA
jgi:pimeloyl-ACP methyl ester carboxylesterase